MNMICASGRPSPGTVRVRVSDSSQSVQTAIRLFNSASRAPLSDTGTPNSNRLLITIARQVRSPNREGTRKEPSATRA